MDWRKNQCCVDVWSIVKVCNVLDGQKTLQELLAFDFSIADEFWTYMDTKKRDLLILYHIVNYFEYEKEYKKSL